MKRIAISFCAFALLACLLSCNKDVKQKSENPEISVSVNVDGVEVPFRYVYGGKFWHYYYDDRGGGIDSVAPFYMATTETTQALWNTVMGRNPAGVKGDNYPVINLSRNDVREFIAKLKLKTGKTFRLPTELEYDFVASSIPGPQEEYGWFLQNSDSILHEVATKLPNGWGIYDLRGNADEYVTDRIDKALRTDGHEWVLVGSGYRYPSNVLRTEIVDNEDESQADAGFRLIYVK